MKKGFKIGLIIIIFLYLILFFSYKNGYYRNINEEKRVLTDEKIKEYEEDLANGIDVTQKEYIVVTPSYDNKITRGFLKISNIVEQSLDRVIKYVFKKINKMVDEK